MTNFTIYKKTTGPGPEHLISRGNKILAHTQPINSQEPNLTGLSIHRRGPGWAKLEREAMRQAQDWAGEIIQAIGPARPSTELDKLPALLSVNETSTMLARNLDTIRRWCREGKLSATKLGKDWRIPREAIIEILDPEDFQNL